MKLSNGRACNEMVYQCGDCGAHGCKNDECRNQGFQDMRCLRCGSTRGLGFNYKPR
jgi:DNA-directed RNA polymerase subunit RPC12/RpoP